MAALLDTRMPGVYTQEIPTLPPSIAVVPTAIPCFIGYTEFAKKNGEPILKATRIRNMKEYQDWFGKAASQTIEVDINFKMNEDHPEKVDSVEIKNLNVGDFKYRMNYALQLYYANGGGPCFIISTGLYAKDEQNVLVDDLITGLQKAKLAKDITMLVFPDAPFSINADDYNTLTQAALEHCQKMINRVTLLDVRDDLIDNDAVTQQFRSKTPSVIDLKKYAAAYYPFLNTTLDYKYSDKTSNIRFQSKDGVLSTEAEKVETALNAMRDAKKKLKEETDNLTLVTNVETEIVNQIEIKADISKDDLKAKILTFLKSGDLPTKPDIKNIFTDGADTAAVKTAIESLKTSIEKSINDVGTGLKAKFDDSKTAFDNAKKAFLAKPLSITDPDFSYRTFTEMEGVNNLLYNKIVAAIRDLSVPMPPSPAIAGLYVQTDATQGVWKAPANASLAAVISPTVEIDDDFHADLNVDASSGKSVNAIRAYEGKGILVFGARTLAGNDLEWRYISVRRTFCFIEDSVQRAMQDFVFAPNTRDTWIKVKAMIHNFLIEIWKAGGLFGNTPNEAFQINIGQPETMTDVDILEGRMIVEILLRVSRPAEFIILRYEHKFQANAA